ncbi:unnamed protein product [Phytomonas sp. EM1]|nr:unnamed protein product [Phytomonas sp. EM1]|eukprot:CCW60111.1 unnamed protein product [Phytomonas sp. isolate EM1]
MAAIYEAEATGDLEQVLHRFFALPFAPRSGLREGKEAEVEALCGASIDVITAATAVLPLVFRAANTLLRVYAQQGDLGGGGVAGNIGIPSAVGRHFPAATDAPAASTNSQKAYQMVQAMRLVVEWVRRCGSHSSNGAMVYGACTKEIMDFEQRYLT